MESGHPVQYDKTVVSILTSSQDYHVRKHHEDLEILKHPDNLNRDKDYQVINPIWHTALSVWQTDQLKYSDWLELESPSSSLFDQLG